MGHGLLGWLDDGWGFMIFGRGARAKTKRGGGAELKTKGGPSSFLFFFLKILVANFFFFFFGPRPPLAPTWVRPSGNGT